MLLPIEKFAANDTLLFAVEHGQCTISSERWREREKERSEQNRKYTVRSAKSHSTKSHLHHCITITQSHKCNKRSGNIKTNGHKIKSNKQFRRNHCIRMICDYLSICRSIVFGCCDQFYTRPQHFLKATHLRRSISMGNSRDFFFGRF